MRLISGFCIGLLMLVVPAANGKAAVAADTLVVPTREDTVEAGGWTIRGDFAVEDSAAAPGSIGPAEREALKGTLRRIGNPEVYGLRGWQRQKIPKVALFSSALLPGLGQIYVGRRIKVGLAAGFFATYTAWGWIHWKDAQSWTAYRDKLPPGASTAFADRQIEFHKESARDFMWWAGAVWVINMIDAWVDAHLYDLRVYTPPPTADENAHATPAGGSKYVTLSIGF
jgi:hypothetical protein